MGKKRAALLVLAPAARDDLREILRWSGRQFGKTAAERYRALIRQAVHVVSDDPGRYGATERPEIMAKGARTWHLQLSRSRVSGPGVKDRGHFLLYRRRADGVIEVAPNSA